MPKLLIINITCNQGSTGQISEQLGLMMKSLGWDVYLAHGARRVKPSDLTTIPFSSVKDEYLHALKCLLFDADGLGSSRATKRLVEKIKEIGPDVIHLHNLHGYYLNYPILFTFLKALNIPIVWTFHDCWPFTGHCTHPTYANCEQWLNHCSSPCPLLKVYPSSLLLDRCGRNFALKENFFCDIDNLHVVTVSKWLENQTRKSFFRDKDIRYIYNGIDTNVFKPTNYDHLINRYQIHKEEKIILGVANIWDERKGLNDFYQLRKLLPSNYRIILIGISSKQNKELPNGIEGVRRTDSQQELSAYYSLADFFVNPSQAETFGMTTVEALACGTPAVVYNTTACPEVVDNETGWVVKMGDIKGIIDVIYHNAKKKKEANDSQRLACRRRAILKFDKNRNYQFYRELYQQLIR